MRARGFSLLEMLLVLALIATASLLALAAYGGGLRALQLRDGARELAAQLRFTRALAVSSGQPQELVLDPHARTWRGPAGRHGRLPAAGEVEFIGARATRPQPGQGSVRFFPDGAATGGRIRLRDGDAGWDVDIAWLTGEVRLQRWPREAP
jgi:general secretion pathway protein H